MRWHIPDKQITDDANPTPTREVIGAHSKDLLAFTTSDKVEGGKSSLVKVLHDVEGVVAAGKMLSGSDGGQWERYQLHSLWRHSTKRVEHPVDHVRKEGVVVVTAAARYRVA